MIMVTKFPETAKNALPVKHTVHTKLASEDADAIFLVSILCNSTSGNDNLIRSKGTFSLSMNASVLNNIRMLLDKLDQVSNSIF